MRLTINIEQGNAAFDGERKHIETADILRTLADVMEFEGDDFEFLTLMDSNGNTVGKAVKED